jgi:hypothetical protein
LFGRVSRPMSAAGAVATWRDVRSEHERSGRPRLRIDIGTRTVRVQRSPVRLGSPIMPAPQDSALTARSSATRFDSLWSAPSRLTSIRSTSNRKAGLFGLEPRSGRLLQIHVQPAPASLMEANAPPPHQAAFATDDALFIACK